VVSERTKETMKRSKRLISMLVATAGLTLAANHKVAPDLLRPTSAKVDVIVQFTAAPTEHHHQKVLSRGGVLTHDLSGVIRGAAYSVPASAIADLADDPEVAYVAPDRPLHGTLNYTAAAVNASVAWSQYALDGTGIGVAVIDSGISNHPDLKTPAGKLRVVWSQDFVGGGTDDHYGHGGHVAGIIAGNGASSTGAAYNMTFKGIAPNANLINLRVLDQNGNGTDSAVISAINTAIRLKNTYNIRVINLSLGRPVFESYKLDPLCQAVEAAWNAGIVVVIAAGNEGRNNSAGTNGYSTITAPGNDPYVITVGAMKTLETATRK
jgi:serine protease AprX